MRDDTRQRVLWAAAAVLVAVSAALNAAGYLFDLWRSVAPYDEIVHVVTPFTVVLVLSALVHRAHTHHLFFATRLRAALVGVGIGAAVAVLWELVEVLVDQVGGIAVYNPPVDTLLDVALGTAAGAAAAISVDWLLDR